MSNSQKSHEEGIKAMLALEGKDDQHEPIVQKIEGGTEGPKPADVRVWPDADPLETYVDGAGQLRYRSGSYAPGSSQQVAHDVNAKDGSPIAISYTITHS